MPDDSLPVNPVPIKHLNNKVEDQLRNRSKSTVEYRRYCQKVFMVLVAFAAVNTTAEARDSDGRYALGLTVGSTSSQGSSGNNYKPTMPDIQT